MVCPSFCCAACPGVFLELDLQVSLKFGMMPETVIMLCVPEPDFFEELFLPVKSGKQAKNRPKIGFLNLKKNLVYNFHSICSIMKLYTICTNTIIWKNLVPEI